MRIPFQAAATGAGVFLLITQTLKSVSARFTILFSSWTDLSFTFSLPVRFLAC